MKPKKPFLEHLYTTDAYATKAFFAIITGSEREMFKNNPNGLKKLVKKRLKKAYEQIIKEMDDAI
jgi:hypothetical protein